MLLLKNKKLLQGGRLLGNKISVDSFHTFAKKLNLKINEID